MSFQNQEKKLQAISCSRLKGLKFLQLMDRKLFVESHRLVSVAWSLDFRELEFIIYDYLVSEKNVWVKSKDQI